MEKVFDLIKTNLLFGMEQIAQQMIQVKNETMTQKLLLLCTTTGTTLITKYYVQVI